MKTICKQKLPHEQFGFGIFPFYAAHVIGSGFFVVDIHSIEYQEMSIKYQDKSSKMQI
jgi:hypothetical protein